MIRRLMIVALLLIVLFAVLPALAALLASGVAIVLGCPLNEGGAQTCLLFGHDIGGLLKVMFASHWFAYVTVPVAAMVLVVWAIVALLLLLLHRRRRRRARPV